MQKQNKQQNHFLKLRDQNNIPEEELGSPLLSALPNSLPGCWVQQMQKTGSALFDYEPTTPKVWPFWPASADDLAKPLAL